MRDEFVSKLISDRFDGSWFSFKQLRARALCFVVGLSCAAIAFGSLPSRFNDDDLAKLAELAGCSTGQPASSLWLNAAKSQQWPFRDNATIAKRLLVQIDTTRCGIDYAAYSHQGDGKIAALPPGDRYN